MSEKKRIVIMGAAGKDFHVFNTVYRDNPEFEVVCFTATQIPNIEGRKYPAELAGSLYPEGIPILPEDDLPKIIEEKQIDQVVFAYSDVSHEYVMHRGSLANAHGADYVLTGTRHTMLKSSKKVIAVCAVRTGSGKSQTSRYITKLLSDEGIKAAAIRHPMPYGDLTKQKVQRFASYEDMDKAECTIEEREEYEPYIERGLVVFAGVDYEAILREAEKEADVIIWDGGNNDTPFVKPDLHIVVADPLRAGHEMKYHPGETNFRMADVIIINKVDSATPEQIEIVEKHAKQVNPNATILKATSPITVEDPAMIKGKKVLCVEDGPTITHGEMGYGAATVAAQRLGAGEIVDPKPYLVGSIKAAFEKYTQLDKALPALGYFEEQLKELEEVINNTPCDVVLAGTPIDLSRLIKTNKPIIRVRYEFDDPDDTIKRMVNDLVKS